MPLSIGDKLGAYEILSAIGAGGMGEVYRARDGKLDREVAIKVLPAAMARDRDRLTRFEREAKVLASLNHPNIAQIYGLEENADTRALVMELVAGSTLAVPQPVESALNYAKQIAEALEAAHEKGITHRDLKPANVMVTPEGVVKVLDFGLASVPAREAGIDPENSPTLTMAATQAGMIMGTAAYMSPEQAAGKPVDKRSDIWSFGVVLWEMLTGKKLFDGETLSHILAHVLTAPLDFGKLPESTPPPVADLVKRCLERDPRKRLRDIGEARLAIENYLANPGGATVSSRSETRPAGKLAWIVAGMAAAIAIALGAMRVLEKPPAKQTLHFTVAGPENSSVRSIAISPDGRYLAMNVFSNGKSELLLLAMDSLHSRRLPFTEGASNPFWSPDSRHIGFFADGKLKKISVAGGPAQSLCNAAGGIFGGSWNREDVIVFGSEAAGSIRYVTAKGGDPVEVPSTKGRYPVFLPDGRHFWYLRTRTANREDQGIYSVSLDGKQSRRLLGDISAVVFAPGSGGGQLLFIRENTLMALPLDPSDSRAAGDVFPVAENVRLARFGLIPATVSGNGLLVYHTPPGGSDVRNQLGWFDRTGKSFGLVGDPGGVYTPAISPDGRAVAYRRSSREFAGGSWNIWLRDLTRGTETRFTTHESLNGTPFWSPKGDRIVFESNRNTATHNLYQKATNGSGQDEMLLPHGNLRWPTQWSPDGRYIVFNEQDPKTKFDLWVLPADGSGTERRPIPFLRTEFNERLGQISPDGRWMTFTSDRSGKNQIYVRPFPSGDGEWTISVAGGSASRWRGDGKELFFLAEDGKLMAVPVKASSASKPAFEAGPPAALFDSQVTSDIRGIDVFDYDVTPDGKRFLISTTNRSDAASTPELTVVTNWDAGLRK